MIVCHCNAVSEQTIVDEIVAGADSVAEVGARCAAGTTCGGCIPRIEALLALADEVVA
ncbi:MAG: (2Fe-2S)-binding protein [Acidimicrobiia bacterium]|nr:(2Fe-2S)-binding protein [Acidimicrobiia bacterium]